MRSLLNSPLAGCTLERAGGRGIANVVASQGDARRPPYADAEFDAAFLVAGYFARFERP
jgi:hypothetical protein